MALVFAQQRRGALEQFVAKQIEKTAIAIAVKTGEGGRVVRTLRKLPPAR